MQPKIPEPETVNLHFSAVNPGRES